MHKNTLGVQVNVGSWKPSDLRGATFCLAPSGWGFGWRTYIALAMLCVPVIIQPLVEQAYHDVLPYSEFSLRFDPVDIEQLPDLLRAVSQREICRLRRAALRYRRLLMWDGPHGLAYEVLQLVLCHRAASLHTRLGRPSQAWMQCANVTAEQLLATSDA